MARIDPLPVEQLDASCNDIRDTFVSKRGAVPNMFLTLAHVPELLRSTFSLIEAAMQEGEVPVRVKEIVAVRVSWTNACKYCLDSHLMLARRFGVTEDQIRKLTDEGEGDFTDAEKAAIAYAESLTREPSRVPEEIYGELKRHWNETQIIELTCVVGAFNYFNRFNNAIETDLTVYPAKKA